MSLTPKEQEREDAIASIRAEDGMTDDEKDAAIYKLRIDSGQQVITATIDIKIPAPTMK